MSKSKKNEEKNLSVSEKASEDVAKSYLQSHGRPMDRRELLASGVIPFAASVAMPNWLKMFANVGVAQAEDLVCTTAAGGDLPTFVQIKLNGGAAMSYNFIPTGKGGQLLSSYSRIGGGTGANIPLLRAFSNNAMFYAQSGFYTGLSSVVLPQTMSKSAFVGLMVSSQDDSSMNAFGMTGMIQKLGAAGSILPSLGRAETITGIAAAPAIVAPSAPLRVGRYEDVIGALGVEGALKDMTSDQKIKLFTTIQGLTAQQVAGLSGMSGGATLSRLMQCANITNTSLIGNSGSLNISPLSNAAYATLWGITANTATTNQDFVFATMVYNAINGNAGPVSFDMGGYDYHNNPRATTDTRDIAAGVVVGKTLQSFALMGKPGYIVVCSDGSVSSADSDQPGAMFTSDRGLNGCMYIIAYHPTRGVTVALDQNSTNTSQQIGYLTAGQDSDTSSVPTGNNPEKAAAAAFLNYVSFAGKPVSSFETITNRVFDSSQIDLLKKIA